MGFKKLDFEEYSESKMRSRSESFLNEIITRRTIREFSDRIVPIDIINNCIKTAASAPSGANKQTWQCVIVRDSGIKTKSREAAEKEEKEFYGHRAEKE